MKLGWMARARGLVAMAVLALAAPVAFAQDDEGGWVEAPTVLPIGAQDRLYGSADARFSLIVWLDPECPYCKVLGEKPRHVVDGSGGRVNLAVRLYPLSFHGRNAVAASTTALCVADQAGAAGYYRFLYDWMANTASNGRGIRAAEGQPDPVAALAMTAGARNRAALATCVASTRTGARLTAEMRSAEAAGIQGTPAVALRDNHIGHTIMVSGAIEEADMRSAIKALTQADDQPDAAGAPGGATH